MTSLDVSNNKNLVEIYCSNNSFTTFSLRTDVGQLNSLETLVISNCPNLATLSCSNRDGKGKLSSLGVSGCAKLTDLDCMNNLLTELDLKGCDNLTTLYCCMNLMTELDITENPKLILDNLVCGRQWLNAEKIANRTLKLYLTSSNKGSGKLKELLNYNTGVTLVWE